MNEMKRQLKKTEDKDSLTSSSSSSDSESEDAAEQEKRQKENAQVLSARGFRQSVMLRNNSISMDQRHGFSAEVAEVLTEKPLPVATASAPFSSQQRSISRDK
ncbi:unnamed protein product, partial [Amoebophrya sp. A25]|eukprot:GSA25T00018214001.1